MLGKAVSEDVMIEVRDCAGGLERRRVECLEKCPRLRPLGLSDDQQSLASNSERDVLSNEEDKAVGSDYVKLMR